MKEILYYRDYTNVAGMTEKCLNTPEEEGWIDRKIVICTEM